LEDQLKTKLPRIFPWLCPWAKLSQNSPSFFKFTAASGSQCHHQLHGHLSDWNLTPSGNRTHIHPKRTRHSLYHCTRQTRSDKDKRPEEHEAESFCGVQRQSCLPGCQSSVGRIVGRAKPI